MWPALAGPEAWGGDLSLVFLPPTPQPLCVQAVPWLLRYLIWWNEPTLHPNSWSPVFTELPRIPQSPTVHEESLKVSAGSTLNRWTGRCSSSHSPRADHMSLSGKVLRNSIHVEHGVWREPWRSQPSSLGVLDESPCQEPHLAQDRLSLQLIRPITTFLLGAFLLGH